MVFKSFRQCSRSSHVINHTPVFSDDFFFFFFKEGKDLLANLFIYANVELDGNLIGPKTTLQASVYTEIEWTLLSPLFKSHSLSKKKKKSHSQGPPPLSFHTLSFSFQTSIISCFSCTNWGRSFFS